MICGALEEHLLTHLLTYVCRIGAFITPVWFWGPFSMSFGGKIPNISYRIRVLNPNGIWLGAAIFAGLTNVTDRPTDRQTTLLG